MGRNGIGLGIALSMALGGALLTGCSFSRRALFPAKKLDPSYQFARDSGTTELWIDAGHGVKLNALHFDHGKLPLVLYFHGNGGALDMWQSKGAVFGKLGLNLLIVDYRGYGKSGGVPSEEGVYEDADSAYATARRLGYEDSSIYVYGQSLGTGVATHLAQGKRLRGLILESGYHHIRPLVYDKYWFLAPRLYFPYDFNSCAYAKNVVAPTLIFHGTADKVIPFTSGETLSKCFDAPVRFVPVPGGTHRNVSESREYRAAMRDFVGTPDSARATR